MNPDITGKQKIIDDLAIRYGIPSEKVQEVCVVQEVPKINYNPHPSLRNPYERDIPTRPEPKNYPPVIINVDPRYYRLIMSSKTMDRS